MNTYRALLRRAAPLLAGLAMAGCSVLTIKFPDTPLSARELDARLLTRDYAAHFASTITHLLDDALPAGTDPAIRSQALRLKLGAVTESTRAAAGSSPIASLLDTWAFALQLRDFLATGAGSDLLGSAQPGARLATARLADEADALARKVAGSDYPRYHAFVLSYVEHDPLQSADCVRSSVLSAWMIEQGDPSALRVEGTVAQALGDVSDRLRLYGEQLPAMSLWQAELALDRAGVDGAAYQSALRNIDARLARISALADTSPALAHEAIAELRGSLRASSDRLDASWRQMLRTLHVEREALAANIAAERQGVVDAFDLERNRFAADAAQIADRTVDTSWRELRKLVREALLLLSLLALLVLGLPFAAGYAIGRQRGRRRED